MKNTFVSVILLVLINSQLFAQEKKVVEGEVTFVNTKNVYIKFEKTKDITINDTLLLLINDKWTKSLVVQMISSRSYVTIPLLKEGIFIGQKAGYYKKTADELSEIEERNKIEERTNKPTPIVRTKLLVSSQEDSKERKQTYNGRIMVSTNGSMKKEEQSFNRVRTSYNFDIYNIKGGKFSVESYLTYRRRFGTDQTQDSFNNDFKVYTLALLYDINNNTRASFGRKINNRMANMGAIDGLQIEHKYKKVVFGGFAGERPDYDDYSINLNLQQVGAFIAHETEKGKGIMQTSLAFADQRNHFKTDRRFAYFQHSNSIIKNLSLFYSIELDLFQNIDSVKTNKINLTSTFVSLRYKPFKKLSITTTYDNRRNVIYYESFRTYLDQLINQETRQGVRLNMNYRVTKSIYFNASGFYRYQESKPEPTKNYVANISFSKIPMLKAQLNLSVNTMNTYYFDGNIYGARITKDFFKSKLYTEFNYRKVDYRFVNTEQPNLNQDILGFSANIYGKKNTSFMLSYEGTFEPTTQYNRYFITISQRFRNKN
ncbi:hypothetical protein EGI22_12580 [Lacihabitans sp. LS3-19]|uniref:hypothetical protein n=1 Tax=Lacihabitans sp. LS3-19 TaxID=2487335 RepID=UPI0020CD87EF|nr:hypothetical protein [Lacihabitans sp. LS3-19]MCP9768754.1 hypothetical protein [Lacihabitans sp. LS3-19]